MDRPSSAAACVELHSGVTRLSAVEPGGVLCGGKITIVMVRYSDTSSPDGAQSRVGYMGGRRNTTLNGFRDNAAAQCGVKALCSFKTTLAFI